MILRFFPYDLQLKHTFTVAGCSRISTPGVLVEIEYEGITGYGEASMPPYLGESTASVIAFLRKVNLQSYAHPYHLEDILEYVDSIEQGNTAAKAAVDIALHDLCGKLSQLPCHRIWGLNENKTPDTSYTIGMDRPEVLIQKVKEVEGKFNILKIKLGGEQDKEIIRTIRQVSSLPITVDANQGWKDKYLALDMIHWLKEKGVLLIEQPMPKEQIEDMAWLTPQSPLPVFADESVQGYKDLIRLNGLFTGVNIKLMKCGGLREARKMIDYARASGLLVMLGCMTETSCAVSAAAQLSPIADFADLDGNLLISNDPFKGINIRQGRITLNDKPGIGVEKCLSYAASTEEPKIKQR